MFFSYREIERSLFEHIRLKIVQLGYLPDVTLYGTVAAYKAAKDVLRNSLPDKMLIEVFGVGNAENRDEKTVGKITIDRKAAPRGDLGAFGVTQFEEELPLTDPPTFKKIRLPDATRNIRYEIRYITNSMKYGRLMSEIIDESLGMMRFLRSINDAGVFQTDKRFYIELVNEVDVSDKELIEYAMTYDVKDVFLARETDLGSGIVIATDIPSLENVGGAVVEIPDAEMNDPELPTPIPPSGFEINIATQP